MEIVGAPPGAEVYDGCMARVHVLSAAGLCLALFASCAAADPAAAPAVAAPVTEAPTAVKEVTIDPIAKPPVCRRYVPTGSRIATKRCESAEVASSAAREAERDQIRRDLTEMRMRQDLREQARIAAEAMRRRGP